MRTEYCTLFFNLHSSTIVHAGISYMHTNTSKRMPMYMTLSLHVHVPCACLLPEETRREDSTLEVELYTLVSLDSSQVFGRTTQKECSRLFRVANTSSIHHIGNECLAFLKLRIDYLLSQNFQLFI